jgi:septal ring factor EnvC (AmiA/AmiB activator)
MIPRNKPGRTITLILAAIAVAVPVAAAEQENPERVEAESRLQEVLVSIAELQEQLADARQEHGAEQQRLRETDLAIQETNLKYRALEARKKEREKELAELEAQRADYLAGLDHQLAQLAEQVRSSYRTGQQSRIRLVLNQDDPTRIGRMLAYYDYLNKAQVAKIQGLKEAVAELDRMQQSIDQELNRIEDVQAEQQVILDELDRQRQARMELLASIVVEIGDSEEQLDELERNRADLQALIERLANILGDIPQELDHQAGLRQQKGRLPMPVQGRVRYAFGQNRAAGLRWQGWLIAADPGTPVRAVAYGRVAFADWLRGYGLLMIIDHGQGFMSLYGHNEILLREAGSWVGAGDEIAVVGSNAAGNQGMYFELRKEGQAVDPAAWMAR